MKAKMILMTLLAGVLSACSLDDNDVEEWKPTTETWEMNIEPEYVVDIPTWGGYSQALWAYSPRMEAYNDKGEHMTFTLNQIEGFSYEEGFRYKLLVDASTTDPKIMDGPGRTFKLKKLVSMEYVGIRTEGQREVTMDVQRVIMIPPNDFSSQCYSFLCGKAIDGSEKLDMAMGELWGCDPEMFQYYDESFNSHGFLCRMKLTITPADRPVFRSHQYRIRLKELISKEELPRDSTVKAATDEEYFQKF